MANGFLEDASFNQSPAFGDVNLFTADKPLADAAARLGLDLKALAACGKDYGAAETLDLGRVANEVLPRLRTMDATPAAVFMGFLLRPRDARLGLPSDTVAPIELSEP